MNGRERLAAWITKSQLNQRQAAREIGIDHTILNGLLRGRRGIGLTIALRIERHTGIPVEAFEPTEVDSREPVGVRKVANGRIGKR